MTDVWLSTKKWTCKYCDITINDDAPSRNQHENGFRHRNAKERHLRNIYKTGAEKKRTDELERREMEKIDRAAAIAHARDTGAPIPVFAPSTSSSSAPAKKTAAGALPSVAPSRALGGGGDDEEDDGREHVGQPGEWETVVAPPSPPPPPAAGAASTSNLAVPAADADVPAQAHAAHQPRKRMHLPESEAAEARSFKFQRKERVAYLDDDDDGLPAIRLKRPELGAAPASVAKVEEAPGGVDGFRCVQWGERLPEPDPAPAALGEAADEQTGPAPVVDGAQVEDDADVKPSVRPDRSPPPPAEAAEAPSAGGMFKKRRGPPKGVGKRPTV